MKKPKIKLDFIPVWYCETKQSVIFFYIMYVFVCVEYVSVLIHFSCSYSVPECFFLFYCYYYYYYYFLFSFAILFYAIILLFRLASTFTQTNWNCATQNYNTYTYKTLINNIAMWLRFAFIIIIFMVALMEKKNCVMESIHIYNFS